MRDDNTRGLRLRGSIWWLNIDRRIGGRQVSLHESTGCRAGDIAGAVAFRDRRIAEESGANVAPKIARVDIGERTWADAAAEYVIDLERRGKDPTRAQQDIYMVIDTIGLLPLTHVHQGALQHWIDAQRGVRASGTVDRALRTVSTVLHFAAAVLRDGSVPWFHGTVPLLRSPDWGARQRRPITWDEQDRLVEALPLHLVAPVLWAVHTGARQEEVVSLRWDQCKSVDGLPDWAAWWIPPEIRKASSKDSASDRKGRYVVCNRAARAVVAGQAGLSPDWVFPSPKGGRLYRITNNGWRAARKLVGLEDVRVHDLRHTFGDRAADAGIAEEMVAVLLGHRRGSVTAHYSRPGLARLVGEAERIVRPVARLEMVREG